MSIEFEDSTGKPPSVDDVNQAIRVVQKAVIQIGKIAAGNPELAVELPNILRILRVVEAVYKRAARE